MIITRFAPSPTGELHIGGARTALFGYLAAKSTGGKFLLRIEDTDRTRFVEGSDQRIILAMVWLGLIPENVDNIMFQSKRLEIYKKYAIQLVQSGQAYICACSKEKLEADRAELEKQKKQPMYIRTCRDKNIQFADVKEGEYVIRMKTPLTGKIVVNDIIRGEVEFDLSLFDDQIIMKSDGYPTYYLAAAVDDHDMQINHVIRGEEWLSSTPKSVLLNQMLQFPQQQYAHMPMVLAPDRSKLSKRYGATSVVDYKDLGYLPEAIINFLVLQGWNLKDNREYFSLEELEKEFNLDNVNKASAIFDIDKLNSINEYYLKLQTDKIKTQNDSELISNYLSDFGVSNLAEGEFEIIARGGFKTFREMAVFVLELRKEPEYDGAMLVFKKSTKENTIQAIKLVSEKLVSVEDWNSDKLQEALSLVVSENGLTNGDVFWPVRVAMSGKEKSPSPVELLVALGKKMSLDRLERARRLINGE